VLNRAYLARCAFHGVIVKPKAKNALKSGSIQDTPPHANMAQRVIFYKYFYIYNFMVQ